ncbi:hypothetical protein PABG_04678 [Paracoccidioides brasiliensis Pb03]|nr:hypothetical protein PABG_04678 [Paracoccidioides brasiliensis Pb03]
MKQQQLLLLTQFVLAASATIEFTAPPAGSVLKGGSVLNVEWRHLGNDTESLASTLFDLKLCAGGNREDSYDCFMFIARGRSFGQGNSVSVPVPANIGGNEPNAYFLQMIIHIPQDPQPVNSQRFTLTDMTGSFDQKLLVGIEDISATTHGPPTFNELRKRQANLPYEEQQGTILYAPAPIQPPTRISLKTAGPLHPTSSFNIATSYLPPATVMTTVTALPTFTVMSIENTAAPAPVDEEMQKFLNRWKD